MGITVTGYSGSIWQVVIVDCFRDQLNEVLKKHKRLVCFLANLFSIKADIQNMMEFCTNKEQIKNESDPAL